MKKVIIGILALVVVLVVAVVVFFAFFLNGVVKKGIEAGGPQITKVDVKVQGVALSVLSGKGDISGLVIGNPSGSKTPAAIKAEKISVSLQPSSVFSKKVVIHSIAIESPEITFEGGMDGNNLTKIQENVEQSLGASDPNSKKRMQVDDFVIRGGKINVALTELGGKGATIPLPEIHLQNLGNTPEGITAADLAKEVVAAVTKESTKSIAANAAKLGIDAVEKLGGESTKGVTDAVKGVTDLFK